MSFAIGTANFNANNSISGQGSTDLTPYATTWQVQTCGGVNVGTPQQALQVVAINKQQVAICNPESVIGAYNTVQRFVLTDGQNIAIAANSVHSLAFKVISGDGTINISGAGAQAIEAGEADSFTASTLLSDGFAIACITGKIVIITIGEAPPA